jgi:hypothetical protein
MAGAIGELKRWKTLDVVIIYHLTLRPKMAS